MNQPQFDTFDYAIGGKLVVAKTTVTEAVKELMQDGDPGAIHHIKSELIHQLADYMLSKQLVEFTHWDDPISYNRTIAVRAYLAPNDQIKVIRTTHKV